LTYIAGRNAALEALKAGHRVRRVLIESTPTEAQHSLRAILEAAAAARVPVERVPASRLAAIHPRHQGVAVEVAAFSYASFAEVEGRVRLAGARALVLALDRVQDPQNLGALLRTALAVDATAVLLPARRSAPVTAAAVRASAGAAEHLCVCQVPNLVRALGQLRTLGMGIVGLDVHSGVPLDEADLSGALALVVGSEGSGLGRLVRERCELLVHLPLARASRARGPRGAEAGLSPLGFSAQQGARAGATESLNAAVAGSIALYHVFRLRTHPAPGTGGPEPL
jgi:23S rRNA (guanosine2251-2'-O)-methyltransferase